MIREHRYLAGVLAAIPLAMLLVSMILNLMRLDGGGALSWVFTESNASAIRHIFAFGRSDSWFPMASALAWFRAHTTGDLYDDLFFVRHIKFQYPATSLLFVQWLNLVPGPGTRLLNVIAILVAALNVAGMMLVAASLLERAKATAPRLFAARRWIIAIVAMATLCFYPLLKALYLGQIQTLLDALFTFACCGLLRGRPVTAGVLMGISTLIKPQMGLFVLWGVLRRDVHFTAGWAVPVATGFAASLVLYGVGWPAEYLRVLRFISLHGESYYANQSINGLLNRLFNNGPNLTWLASSFPPVSMPIYYATTVCSLIFIATGLLYGRGHESRIASFLVAAICFTLASPVSWEHHFGILLPAFAFCLIELLTHEEQVGARWNCRVGLATAYLFAANSFAMLNLLWATPLNFLQSYVFFAALGTLCLVTSLARVNAVAHRPFQRERTAGASS